jgi:hypothetical protein
MNKRIVVVIFALLLSALTITMVSAGGATNGDYFDWNWQGDKSGYFKETGSGIVHMWSYDRPADSVAPGDAHFIFKPLEKFPDSTCDADAVWVRSGWIARNVYNLLDSTEQPLFSQIFPDLDKLYLGCAYQMQ